MLWAGCKASVYLDDQAASVRVDGAEVMCWQGSHWETLLQEVVTHLAAQRCKQLDVWLSASLARPFLMPVVQGLKRWSEVEAMAHGMAESATQLHGPLHVWLGRWRGDRPTLAVACSMILLKALQDLKQTHGLPVKKIVPAWHWAAQQDANDAHLMLVHEASATTLLHKETSGHWGSVATYAPSVPHDQLQSWVVRQAFFRGVDAAQVTQACLQVKGIALTDACLPDSAAPPLRVMWGAHAD